MKKENILIDLIVEVQSEELDNLLSNELQHQEEELKKVLTKRNCEDIFENYIMNLLIKTQDISYKKGLKDGLKINEDQYNWDLFKKKSE